MSNRAQVGLIFTDDELYENCIIPLKENRELSKVIIKCLTSYYYNEEIRNRIEGYEPEAENNTAVSEAQDIINNIQATISLMSFGLDEAENTLQEGMQDISDIMGDDPTNTEIYKKYTEEQESNSLQNVPSVNIEKFKQDKKNILNKNDMEGINATDTDKITATLSMLVSAVSGLYTQLGVPNNPFSSSDSTIQEPAKKAEENVKNNEIVPDMDILSAPSPYPLDFGGEELSDTYSFIEDEFKSDSVLEENLDTSLEIEPPIGVESSQPVNIIESTPIIEETPIIKETPIIEEVPESAIDDIRILLSSLNGGL